MDASQRCCGLATASDSSVRRADPAGLSQRARLQTQGPRGWPNVRRRVAPGRPARTSRCAVASALQPIELTLPGSDSTPSHVASVGVAVAPFSVGHPEAATTTAAGQTALPSWGLALAMLAAATAAVCSTVTVFMLAMWPTLKATERASLATEAAMRAMEEASEATTKASREMEVLMLRTQAELPETLAAVEEASLQWDRLGLEIRDSGRRFGLTNPGATAGTLAAPRSGNRAPGSVPVSTDPLLAALQDGAVGGGGSAADLGDQLAVAAGMLPGAETVSAAVGRFVEEATQAGAAALAGGAVAAAGGVAGADPDVLNASLEALRSWRTRLNKVLEATRDVVAGAAEEVSNQTRDAAQSSRAVLNPGRGEASARAAGGGALTTPGKPGANGATQPDGSLVQIPPEQQGGDAQNGILTWLGGGLRRVPGAVLTGAAVTGGFVAGALSAVKLPGLRRPSDPLPATADEDEARAERAKAVALALALAEEAAEEARAATSALGRLFNTTAAAITSPSQGEAVAGALPGGVDGTDGGDISPSLALADEAAALVAAKAAEAAMQEASRASTALLGALAESRAAGDPIQADVLAALEELPAKVFAVPVDDDSYDYSILADGDSQDGEREGGDGEGTDRDTASV